MTSGPLLRTFVGTLEQLELALKSGADALILDDSKLSVRSYTDDFNVSHFDKISELACKARLIDKDVHLSVNVDVMLHENHLPLIQQLFQVMKDNGLDCLRVQDPGMIHLVQEMGYDFQIHLATETGNCNEESAQFYAAQGVAQQTLTNDMPHDSILQVIEKVQGHFEALVHGPILIQYTHRRLMGGSKEAEKDPNDIDPIMQKYAIDVNQGGQKFPFYDNVHGHLMYFWADRCLIKYMKLLMPLNLTAWLIDGRGESLDYLKEALLLYRQERDRYREDPTLYKGVMPENIQRLKAVAKRPYKAGFFLANRTDYVKRGGVKDQEGLLMGRVVDVIKGEGIVVEARSLIKEGQECVILTPDRKKLPYNIEHMLNMQGERVSFIEAGQLVRLHWVSRVVPQSILRMVL